MWQRNLPYFYFYVNNKNKYNEGNRKETSNHKTYVVFRLVLLYPLRPGDRFTSCLIGTWLTLSGCRPNTQDGWSTYYENHSSLEGCGNFSTPRLNNYTKYHNFICRCFTTLCCVTVLGFMSLLRYSARVYVSLREEP